MAQPERYTAVCQWCGARGSSNTTYTGAPPNFRPVISGKCKSHPSGNPNMEHGPRWERS